MPSARAKELKRAMDALIARSRELNEEHERITAEYARLVQEFHLEEERALAETLKRLKETAGSKYIH